MSKVFQLKKILKNESFVFIQPHNFPDPDAAASAFGLQFILKQFNIKSKIIYSGFITNKTVNDMVEKLKIKIYHITQVSIKPTSKILVVDTKIGVSNITFLKAQYIGFIDHHEGNFNKKNSAEFYDLQPKTGACSTIIGDYILNLGLKKIPRNVATALLIGIYIDTFRLMRKTTQLDVEIVDKLYPFVDVKFLNFVALNIIELDDLKNFSLSIKNLKLIKDIGIVKVMKLRSGHFLGIVCDFFIQLRELTLIIGYYPKQKNISISIRSEKPEYSALKIINEITHNIGVGGGHSTMAAGVVDLNLVCKNFNFEKHLLNIIQTL